MKFCSICKVLALILFYSLFVKPAVATADDGLEPFDPSIHTRLVIRNVDYAGNYIGEYGLVAYGLAWREQGSLDFLSAPNAHETWPAVGNYVPAPGLGKEGTADANMCGPCVLYDYERINDGMEYFPPRVWTIAEWIGEDTESIVVEVHSHPENERIPRYEVVKVTKRSVSSGGKGEDIPPSLE